MTSYASFGFVFKFFFFLLFTMNTMTIIVAMVIIERTMTTTTTTTIIMISVVERAAPGPVGVALCVGVVVATTEGVGVAFSEGVGVAGNIDIISECSCNNIHYICYLIHINRWVALFLYTLKKL